MADTTKTELLRARRIHLFNVEDGRPTERDRNGNEMLRAVALLEDGSLRHIIAFDKPKGAKAFTAPTATDLAKAVTKHHADGKPPTIFHLRGRMLPILINPRTGKPYPPQFAVESFSITPLERLSTRQKSRDNNPR